jgi:hypothetical protein
VSAQRARPGDAAALVDAPRGSIHPNVPGVPWWAAILIAVGATACGFAIDAGAGHSDLTFIFSACYVVGCVAAALAVRQEALFTAIIQPPLILFWAVPGAYWLFHGRKVSHLKDLLINCGYPLIERFPLMLGTAGGVLVIGLVRWYLGTFRRTSAADAGTATGGAVASAGALSLVGGVIAKLRSAVRRERDADGAAAPAGRSGTRRGRTARPPANARRAASHTNRSASRRDPRDPRLGSPRRPSRGGHAGPRDFDAPDPSRRAPRPGPQGEPDRRQPRRDPRTRVNPYERPRPGSRFDAYPPPDYRYPPRGGPDGYEPPRRRPAPRGATGTDPLHQPIPRVRYRGESRGRPPGESRDRDV